MTAIAIWIGQLSMCTSFLGWLVVCRLEGLLSYHCECTDYAGMDGSPHARRCLQVQSTWFSVKSHAASSALWYFKNSSKHFVSHVVKSISEVRGSSLAESAMASGSGERESLCAHIGRGHKLQPGNSDEKMSYVQLNMHTSSRVPQAQNGLKCRMGTKTTSNQLPSMVVL